MYRILIADDELIEKAVLHQTLEKQFKGQCEIYQAANGREALILFEEKDIQIAIMDIEMPGINGIEASIEMKRRNPECCIIFLTAFDEFSYARKAISIHALEYLLKPYEDKELIGVVEEAMRITDKVQKEKKWLQIRVEESELMRETAECDYEEEQDRTFGVAESIRTYIQENYIYDISMQDAARAMNYSDAYFCKLFKQYFDKNFTVYLTEFRIEKAKKLLEQPAVNVKKVGESVGYMDSNYFAKVFRRTTGVSPTEYRLKLY